MYDKPNLALYAEMQIELKAVAFFPEKKMDNK